MDSLVICAGPRALPVASIATNRYSRVGLKSIVVRPSTVADHDSQFASDAIVIDDESIGGYFEVKCYLEIHSDRLREFNRAPAWYLQQYLKLATSTMLGGDLTFVCDGDTIFSGDFLQSVFCEPAILTTRESHEPYDRLIASLGLQPPRQSCVANGNFFPDCDWTRRLGTPDGFCDVIERYVLPSCGEEDFSEYQIVGSLLGDRLEMKRVSLFRRFDLLSDANDVGSLEKIEHGLRKYDALSFETAHHRGVLRRMGAQLWYAAGKTW